MKKLEEKKPQGVDIETLIDKLREKLYQVRASVSKSIQDMQSQYDTYTLHSANLYQVFTYVKNKEHELRNKAHKVSGMLLYAQTDEEIQPNNTYSMSGNRIDVKTLNLDCDFSEIRRQLDSIAKEFFDS